VAVRRDPLPSSWLGERFARGGIDAEDYRRRLDTAQRGPSRQVLTTSSCTLAGPAVMGACSGPPKPNLFGRKLLPGCRSSGLLPTFGGRRIRLVRTLVDYRSSASCSS
jgi:hypothetical protein